MANGDFYMYGIHHMPMGTGALRYQMQVAAWPQCSVGFTKQGLEMKRWPAGAWPDALADRRPSRS